LKYIKIVLALYIPLTFLAIAVVPEATQWEWPAWRGFASHKNTLGEIALISTIVWMSGISLRSMKRSMWYSVFGVASLVLVVGSKSITCLMTLCFVALIVLCFHFTRRFGPAMCTAAAGSLCAIGLLIVVNAGGLGEIFGQFGRDTSFTGRTDVWDVVIDEAKAHPLLGAGFGGFWTPENDVRIYSGEISEWRATEGHEGYLDLWNETGAVGMFLLMLMVISYFRNAVRVGTDFRLWQWLFISILIVNTMESTLFRPASFTGWVFVISYLALQTDVLHDKEEASLPLASSPAAEAA
jgi:exopolysaccharide production protein ExoQ